MAPLLPRLIPIVVLLFVSSTVRGYDDFMYGRERDNSQPIEVETRSLGTSFLLPSRFKSLVMESERIRSEIKKSQDGSAQMIKRNNVGINSVESECRAFISLVTKIFNLKTDICNLDDKTPICKTIVKLTEQIVRRLTPELDLCMEKLVFANKNVLFRPSIG